MMRTWTVTYKHSASLKKAKVEALEVTVTSTGDLVLGRPAPGGYTATAFAQGTWKYILPGTEPYAPKQDFDN